MFSSLGGSKGPKGSGGYDPKSIRKDPKRSRSKRRHADISPERTGRDDAGSRTDASANQASQISGPGKEASSTHGSGTGAGGQSSHVSSRNSRGSRASRRSRRSIKEQAPAVKPSPPMGTETSENPGGSAGSEDETVVKGHSGRRTGNPPGSFPETPDPNTSSRPSRIRSKLLTEEQAMAHQRIPYGGRESQALEAARQGSLENPIAGSTATPTGPSELRRAPLTERQTEKQPARNGPPVTAKDPREAKAGEVRYPRLPHQGGGHPAHSEPTTSRLAERRRKTTEAAQAFAQERVHLAEDYAQQGQLSPELPRERMLDPPHGLSQ
jgi:hypothetical protein